MKALKIHLDRSSVDPRSPTSRRLADPTVYETPYPFLPALDSPVPVFTKSFSHTGNRPLRQGFRSFHSYRLAGDRNDGNPRNNSVEGLGHGWAYRGLLVLRFPPQEVAPRGPFPLGRVGRLLRLAVLGVLPLVALHGGPFGVRSRTDRRVGVLSTHLCPSPGGESRVRDGSYRVGKGRGWRVVPVYLNLKGSLDYSCLWDFTFASRGVDGGRSQGSSPTVTKSGCLVQWDSGPHCTPAVPLPFLSRDGEGGLRLSDIGLHRSLYDRGRGFPGRGSRVRGH